MISWLSLIYSPSLSQYQLFCMMSLLRSVAFELLGSAAINKFLSHWSSRSKSYWMIPIQKSFLYLFLSSLQNYCSLLLSRLHGRLNLFWIQLLLKQFKWWAHFYSSSLTIKLAINLLDINTLIKICFFCWSMSMFYFHFVSLNFCL